MTSMDQGENLPMEAVGRRIKGRLPGPVFALKQGSFGPVKSDLQTMQDNERKQHEEAYIYENGHNDHGMGQ